METLKRLLGIDLGTSSVKAVVTDETGRLLGRAAAEYPIDAPHPGWAEQDTEAWWQATVEAVRGATAQSGRHTIAAIGLSGQMHGTVLVDRTAQPLGPAIIWADQRSTAEVEAFAAAVGRRHLAELAGSAPAAGFMGPTLLWLQRHDPARLARAATVLLPKDYLRLRLTAEIATEASDASATALFDIRRRAWSRDIVETLGLPARLLPRVLQPSDVAGTLQPAAAAELGLSEGTPVVAGCADQVAQAVGNALLDPGHGSVTIGSGGQVFVPLNAPLSDPQLRLHTFCHAPADRWYLLGAMLSAGLSLRWLRNLLGLAGDGEAYTRLSAQAATVPPGANGLLFLPYLAGERSPLMDPLASGGFIGLTLRHGPGDLARAIMEGVAFALRQILETIAELGVPINSLLAVGNGLAGPVWRQIVADVLGRPLALPVGEEKAGVGAALLAGIGTGVYAGYAEARQVVAAPLKTTEPNTARVQFYDNHYQRFRALYPALKPTLHALSKSAIDQETGPDR